MKHIITGLLIFLLLWSAVAVLAQDEPEVTPEPVPDETVAVDVTFIETGTEYDEPVNAFLNLLVALVYAPGAVGIVTVLTSITKRFITVISANLIALLYFAAFWGLFIVVQNLGIEKTVVEQTLNGITELGYALLFMTGTQVASGWWYGKAKSANVPIVGYSKSTG